VGRPGKACARAAATEARTPVVLVAVRVVDVAVVADFVTGAIEVIMEVIVAVRVVLVWGAGVSAVVGAIEVIVRVVTGPGFTMLAELVALKLRPCFARQPA